MSNEFIIKGANVARLQSDFGSTGFKMFKGSILNNVEIAYETWGILSNNNDNAVLIFTGLSTSSHAASSVSQNAGQTPHPSGICRTSKMNRP